MSHVEQPTPSSSRQKRVRQEHDLKAVGIEISGEAPARAPAPAPAASTTGSPRPLSAQDRKAYKKSNFGPPILKDIFSERELNLLKRKVAEMSEDDPVLALRVNAENLAWKLQQFAGSNNGIVDLDTLATAIAGSLPQGQVEREGSTFVFAFRSMPDVLDAKEALFAANPWLFHVGALGLPIAPESARHLCDEIMLIAQAPSAGKVLMRRYDEWLQH